MKPSNIRSRFPGHYVSLLASADNATMIAAMAKPGIKGVEKRYMLNKLMPTPGTFDFSEVTADLATCAAHGLRLVVMILDKTFSGPTRVMPKGLEAFEALNHGGTSTTPGDPAFGGYTALRWTPQYVSTINLLTAALGVAFDTNDAFEGIAFVESSLSMDTATMKAHGYTPEAYRDNMINVLVAAAKNLPHSQVFWNQNFFAGNQSYIAVVADAARKAGVSIGGPDAIPTNAQLVGTVYPLYEALRGKANLFIQMSNPGYSQLHAGTSQYYTADEMLAYCRDNLFSDYIFWMPVKGSGFSFQVEGLAVIAANPVINF